MKLSTIILGYLESSGWSGAELARRAGLSESTITRLVRGRKACGEAHPYAVGRLVAMELERVTSAAFVAGETSATPLRSADLLACNPTKPSKARRSRAKVAA